MALDSSKQPYLHIVRVLLNAAFDTPVDLLLRNDNVTTLRKLTGLDAKLWKYPNDANKEKALTNEQYKELLALESYLNWLQNGFAPVQDGHFDIASKTCKDFKHFIGVIFDDANTITYDEQKAAESQKRLCHLPATSSSASSTAAATGTSHDKPSSVVKT